MSRSRRSFTTEFKAEVVNLVVRHTRSVSDVCREMDLVPSAVCRWVRQSQIDAGEAASGASTTAEPEELARLRREVNRLRMERDILKKATAFFAKESA